MAVATGSINALAQHGMSKSKICLPVVVHPQSRVNSSNLLVRDYLNLLSTALIQFATVKIALLQYIYIYYI